MFRIAGKPGSKGTHLREVTVALKLKIASQEEPLSLIETQAYLRVTDPGEDALLLSMISAVRQVCEQWTGRALVSQTWTWWLDRFPIRSLKHPVEAGYMEFPVNHFEESCRSLILPKPPLQSVEILQTYGVDNQAVAFPASNYFVDTVSDGRLVLNESVAWPTQLRSTNAVEVEFKAGYGNAAQVPEPLKQGMLLWLKLLFADKTWWLEPGNAPDGLNGINDQSIPQVVQSLWAPFKVYHLGRYAS
jgi:uncharacterized phiE125 gp8 family phage protein